MSAIHEMREKYRAFYVTIKSILDKAFEEKRCLTDAERKDVEGLEKKMEAFKETIHRYDSLRDFAEDLEKTAPSPGAGMGQASRSLNPARPGQVQVLTPQQRISDLYPSESRSADLSIGRYLRGVVLGKWDGAEAELRAMNEGTGSAGGYTVPTPLAAQLIDLARNRTVVIKAGALTVPMESQTLAMARLAGDPTAAWRAENAAVSASDMTFEKVTFTAKTLAAMCKLSVELFEDGNNIDQVVSDALASALALELDRAALLGDGSGATPKGLYSQTGVQAVAVADTFDASELISAIQKIYEQNGEPNGMVFSPRTWANITAWKDTTGQPLRLPPAIENLPKFVTNQVPTNLGAGTNESPVFVGDFKQLMIGVRTNLVVEASRAASDGTSRAFESLQVFIRAYLRADIQLAHPAHFVKITGITN